MLFVTLVVLGVWGGIFVLFSGILLKTTKASVHLW